MLLSNCYIKHTLNLSYCHPDKENYDDGMYTGWRG
ncbi:hypothetical protein SLEP1_g27389 [Rubroshorea leprosula]|uniref:Uncharacterized protein n=1 Tax=Rubroshorea leprosula TaxID=152421 RepID=A0AAV5JXC9_9ROSI|nr:hypothetical protein SLEP1_g27389 [Rubroshorea leprosula]